MLITSRAQWLVKEIADTYVLCHKWGGTDDSGVPYVGKHTVWVKFVFTGAPTGHCRTNYLWEQKDELLASQVALAL